jgi:3-hydroxybutyryl-CoA dehydrogenase
MESIGIIGAGQMGKGIAQICLQAGFKVAIYDRDFAKLKNVRLSLEGPLSKFCEKNNKDLNSVLNSLDDDIISLNTFPKCDLIIEAVTENIDIKMAIFKALPAFQDTIFASNTSSIRIEDLSASSHSPQNFIGLHFMNPVSYMQLIEIITHKNTSQEALSKIESFVSYLNKTYIISADSPGFVVNRILIPMINEAIKVLSEQVANVADIDLAMRLGSNHPMGPLELADFIGLDTCMSILNVLHKEFKNSHYAPCPLLIEYVEKGWLGRKSKQGFYNYE